MSILDALYLAKEAWDLVSPRNCFSKSGFYEADIASSECLEDVSVPDDMTEEEFEEYVNAGPSEGFERWGG